MKGLVFTYLMTYGGAAAALFRPFVGLLIYVCFAIIRPDYLWYWCVPPGNYSRIVAVAMLVGWLLKGAGSWRLGRASAITYSLVAYWLWTMLSATFAPDQEMAWHTTEDLTKVVLPFLVGITVINSTEQLKQLAWVMVLSEGYLSYEFTASYLSGFNMAEEGFGDMGRAVLGTSLVCTAVVAFFLCLSSTKWWQKALAGVCGSLIGNSIFLTFSRGAMLSLIAAGLGSFIIMRKRPAHYAVFFVAAVVALSMAGREVRDRFATVFADEKERDASAQSRIDLWGNCLVLIKEAPLVGIGPGHFVLVSDRFGWQRGKEAHSLWLQIGAEVGVPGLAFLACFYGITLRRLWPMARSEPNAALTWYNTTACMTCGALLGFVVSAVFVTVRGVETPYYIVLLAAGALKLNSVSSPGSNGQRKPIAMPGAAGHGRYAAFGGRRAVPTYG